MSIDVTYPPGTSKAYVDAGDAAAVPKVLLDAKGDIIVASAADTAARLPVGTNDQVLTADSAQALGMKWATPAAGGGGIPATLADAAGDLAVASAADTWARLAKGTALQVLRTNAGATALEWADPASGGIPATIIDAAGDLIVGTAADTAGRLAKGTALQQLRVNAAATALEWATIAGGGGSSAPDQWLTIAASDAADPWGGLASPNVVVTAGQDASTALEDILEAAKLEGYGVRIAGQLLIDTPMAFVPPNDFWWEWARGASLLMGQQVGENAQDPPALMVIGGTRTQITTTTTLPINAGSLTATFSTTGTIADGDWVCLSSTQLHGPNRTEEKRGEMIQVRTKTSTVLTFQTPVRYQYDSGFTVTLSRYSAMPSGVTLVRPRIRGQLATMVRQTPLQLRYMRDLTIVDGRVEDAWSCLLGIEVEEIQGGRGRMWCQDVNDRHGASSSFTAGSTTLAAGASAGATTLSVASSAGFPAANSGAAYDAKVEFTARVAGEPVRVINVSGTTWTISPGLVAAKSSGAAVVRNTSYLGYGVHIVGCENFELDIDGTRTRHLMDVKSLNQRPVAFNNKVRGRGTDCSSSVFSSHGSSDFTKWGPLIAVGSGGALVERGTNPTIKVVDDYNPSRTTLGGIYDDTQGYEASVWLGGGTDDGGVSGDNAVVEDIYADMTGATHTQAVFSCHDSAKNIRVVSHRLSKPTGDGYRFEQGFDGTVDVRVSGALQQTVSGTTRRQAAVNCETPTAGTPGITVKGFLRVIDDGCRGAALRIEGAAADGALNGDLSAVIEKRALGASQTEASPQVVLSSGFVNRLALELRAPDTLFASAVDLSGGTLKRRIEWDQARSRMKDGRPPKGPALLRVSSTTWRIPPNVGLTTNIPTAENTLYLVRYEGLGQVMATAGLMVSGAPTGGTTLAMDIGIYKDDGTGYAPALSTAPLATAQITGLTTTGEKTAALSAAYTEEDVYWVGAVFHEATSPSPYPTFQAVNPVLLPPAALTSAGVNARGYNGGTHAGTPGSLSSITIDGTARALIGLRPA